MDLLKWRSWHSTTLSNYWHVQYVRCSDFEWVTKTEKNDELNAKVQLLQLNSQTMPGLTEIDYFMFYC